MLSNDKCGLITIYLRALMYFFLEPTPENKIKTIIKQLNECLAGKDKISLKHLKNVYKLPHIPPIVIQRGYLYTRFFLAVSSKLLVVVIFFNLNSSRFSVFFKFTCSFFHTVDMKILSMSNHAWDDQSHRYGRHQAACRTSGKLWQDYSNCYMFWT